MNRANHIVEDIRSAYPHAIQYNFVEQVRENIIEPYETKSKLTYPTNRTQCALLGKNKQAKLARKQLYNLYKTYISYLEK